MTLGDIIRLTYPDMPSQDQKLNIHSRRGEIFKCSNKDFDKWEPVAERKETGLWTNDFNELVIFVEAPADQEEVLRSPDRWIYQIMGLMEDERWTCIFAIS